MKIAGLIVLGALSASCASMQEGGASASSPGDPSRRGPYAGFALIQGFEDFDTPAGVSADDSDFGFGLRGGMRLDPHWAIEGVLEAVDGYEIEVGPFSEDLDMLSMGFQGKYFFLTEKVQPYALAGIGVARADVDRFDLDDSGRYIRVGGGADFHLDRNVAFFGEITYNNLYGDIDELDYAALTVGLIFRF